MLHVTLVNPEIPPNTGNIGRLCCATNSNLNLIRPLGFSINDKAVKRAGLDYWPKVRLTVWDSLDEYLASVAAGRLVLTGSKRGQVYTDVRFHSDDHILFGPETRGLPAELFERFPARVARIPIYLENVRSLNLSVSAGIMIYEALRQTNTMPR